MMRMIVKRIALTILLVFTCLFVFSQNTDTMQTNQSSGIGVYLTTFIVSFLTLSLFYIILKLVNTYAIGKQKKNSDNTAALEGKTVVHGEISGEVFAAISAALYLYETEQHDYESAILTFNRAAKNYSPWSSKIYGLRQTPRK